MKLGICNVNLNLNIIQSLATNVTKLRPAQLFGKRIREITATESYRKYLSQKHFENVERENEDWALAMSSKVYYYN